jgi:cell division protein FtsB
MGWEQLPPEEPKWVYFCQGCKDRQELIASLQASLAESEARVAELIAEIYRARTDSRYWDEFNTISAHDATRNKNEELKAEIKRLREAMQEIIDMPILYEDVVTDSLRDIAKAALGGAE